MPLNTPLFELLHSIDPSTQIVSEGAPAEIYLPSKAMGYSRKGCLYAMVSRWGECYRMNCPGCGDREGHLFFCHLAGARVLSSQYKTPLKFSDRLCVCHRRNCHRNSDSFQKWLKGLRLHKLPLLDLSEAGKMVKTSMKYGICVGVSDTLPSPTYPLFSEYTPQPVRDWVLDDRRYDPYQLQNIHGVGYSPPGASFKNLSHPEGQQDREFYDHRLIIPAIQGRELVGWQARYVGKDCPKKTPKYLTSPNMSKSNFLYGLDKALLHNIVVITEGVPDVWRVGDIAVSPFGHSLSPMQRMQLRAVYGRNGGCIVMLDPDVNDEAYKLALELDAEGIFPRGVVPVYMYDGKDPDERTVHELREIIGAAAAMLKPSPRGRAVVNGKDAENELEAISAGFVELEEVT